jgi:hypothetical protein
MRLRRSAAALVALSICLVGYHVANFAVFQSEASFKQCTADPRLRCEPGSEAMAASLAPLLPAAVAQVEHVHGKPFTRPVLVYTYATRESYARHGGVRPTSAGVTWPDGVHLSPRLLAQRELRLPILTHELSHLHLTQQMRLLSAATLPSWFLEGMATWASGGGGAEGTSDQGAVYELRSGRHFEPDESQWILFPKRASAYKLRDAMFYRQASLFVGFLHDADPAAFQQLLRSIEARAALGEAVQAAYHRPLRSLWNDFFAQLPGLKP